MSHFDYRTKPCSEWTYYVVDHLPTMNNFYRFDTIEEAIKKFDSLSKDKKSAIGSSLNNMNEIDHIHRADGRAVLVRDSDNMLTDLWRESSEIQEAICKMISALDVRYELSSEVFGKKFTSVAIPLSLEKASPIDSYYKDKYLFPKKADQLISSINEIYLSGKGWIGLDEFIKELENCPPRYVGDCCRTLFVDQLNVNYFTKDGKKGQADISPRNYCLLKKQTELEFGGIGIPQNSSKISLTSQIRAAQRIKAENTLKPCSKENTSNKTNSLYQERK